MASFPTPKWKYDVFLSFRGEDTRTRFIDHLYEALKRKGLNTFMDEDGIRNGMDISSDLWMAIEASRIAIVVLSKNYASSTWCLAELVKIFECKEESGMDVVPIFYDVDPTDVRKQSGSFADAFVKHEASFEVNDLKVRRWRQVLSQVATLKGWPSKKWSRESEMIEKISEEIWKKIQPTLKFIEEDELIGISSKLKQLAPLLNHPESDHDVVLVGIHGMGGIGKTTLARVIYQQILNDFEVHCFLSDVREKFEISGLLNLQIELLSSILLMEKIDIKDPQVGFINIKRAILQKKVLLVVDDVDQLDQINKLIPNDSDLFGNGSRIIITTRNADLLLTFGVQRRFKMEELKYEEALQLFCLNAFRKEYPKEGFLDPSNCIVKLLGGHPLALKVLGASLRNKDVGLWNSTIEELREGVNHVRIFKSLKISYDGLDEKEKEIFLDVACFFKGKKRDCVVEILDGCGFFATRRVELLVQKSLISISNKNRLQMHDLLQEMGRQIVRQKSIQNRLWSFKDIKNKVTEEVESLFFKSTRKIVDIPLLFTRRHKLRLLNFQNMQLQNHSEFCIPTEVRYLKWKGYPLELLSLNFEEYELIQLHMCYSNLKQFWKRSGKCLEKLKYIKLSHSQKLIKTPDFTKIPNLEKLDLEGCTGLVTIHPSIFTAKRLILLNLKDCANLTDLPSHIQIEVLSILILPGCLKIKKISEFMGNTERLLELYLDGTSIRKLPPSIGRLNGLILLNLEKCNKLVFIPSSIQNLKSLQRLDISKCSKLGDYQPKNLEEDSTECMEELDVRGTARRRRSKEALTIIVESFKGLFRKSSSSGVLKLPSFYGLSSLTSLILRDCNLLVIPEGIDSLCSLRDLVLSGNKFSHLPETLARLKKLRSLEVNRCKRLLCFPTELPPGLQTLMSVDCVSLEKIPDISKVDYAYWGLKVDLTNCYQLVDSQERHKLFTFWMEKMLLSGGILDVIIPGSEIPDWYTTTAMGSSITLKWDPYTLNNNKIYHALCVVFGPTTDVVFNDDLPIGIEAYAYGKNSDHEVKGKGIFLGQLILRDTIKFDHVLMFVSRRYGVFKDVERCSEIEIQFDVWSDRSNIKVKKCGVRLYNIDEE